MSDDPRTTVLLLGGTGRTGSRVLRQLTERGVRVRAIMRSAAKVPADLRASATVTLVEAELLGMSDGQLRAQLEGCDAVVSCLGHVLSLAGIFGPPRDLVTRAVQRVCDAAAAIGSPVRLALMSSVSVNRPDRADTRRGTLERILLAILRFFVPPARDNQSAADLLARSAHPGIEWCVVRPDSLIEGEVSEYSLHEGLVSSLFAPAPNRMSNVAHLLCELALGGATWERWKGKMPVILDAPMQ